MMLFKITTTVAVVGLYILDLQLRNWGKMQEMAGADFALASVVFNVTLLASIVLNLSKKIEAEILKSTQSDMFLCIILTILSLVVWGFCISLVSPKRQINLLFWARQFSGQSASRISGMAGVIALLSVVWIFGSKLVILQ